jgi:hypothetical protein
MKQIERWLQHNAVEEMDSRGLETLYATLQIVVNGFPIIENWYLFRKL